MCRLPRTPVRRVGGPDDEPVTSDGQAGGFEVTTLDEQADGRLGEYDRRVLAEVAAWLEGEPGLAERVLGTVSAASRAAVDRVLDAPPVRDAVRRATEELLDRLERLDASPASADPSLPSEPTADLLAEADAEADRYQQRVTRALSVQGAAAGAVSTNLVAAVLAVTTDVAAATVGLTRASVGVLELYGVPASRRRAIGIRTVLAAGERDPGVRRRELIATVGAASASADGDVGRVIADQLGPRAVIEVAEQAIRRVARRRVLAFVPLFGAAAGAAVSNVMTRQVCETARQTGRLYHLQERTGLPVDVLLLS